MIDAALLPGLPEGVLTLLASPPLTATRLLELAARWEAYRLRGPGWPSAAAVSGHSTPTGRTGHCNRTRPPVARIRLRK
jgi:hypothetical protein